MACLRTIVCVLILVGCNKSENSVWKERRPNSANLPTAGNAKIVDERTFEEPVLGGAVDNLEQTPMAISDSFSRKATLRDSVRLYSFPARSLKNNQRQRASLSELGHAIRADNVPKLAWKESPFDSSSDHR